MSTLQFHAATDPEDLRRIRSLNYRTFVEEIPQHHPNPEQSLEDRFERESVFYICKRGNDILGMIALRSNRPFSLDGKLPDLDSHLPPHRSPCEVRLLAVDPRYRSGRVMAGLVGKVYEFFEMRGHDLALISGTLRQKKLYEHLGFTAFGPVVGTPDALYQPMYQFVEQFRRRVTDLGSPVLGRLIRRKVNLMPGPVFTPPPVRAALAADPVSHRSEPFNQLLGRTRRLLCELTVAPAAAVALGSGTLANDLVAGQLAQIPGRGLILRNGEFGRRLVDHASRLQLDFEVLDAPWGGVFREAVIREKIAAGDPPAWLWAVHAETSTGVLNDLGMLKRLAGEFQFRLALDCVSSLGVVACDLRGVALASGVSGKGLRSIAGLALVLHDGNPPPPRRPVPRYLDLRLYLGGGVPFTMPSNLVTALCLSLERLKPEVRFTELREAADRLRGRLEAAGLPVLAEAGAAFPGAITIPLPAGRSSTAVGDALQREGWLLSYQSDYLVERNWIQVCLLGVHEYGELDALPAALAKRTG